MYWLGRNRLSASNIETNGNSIFNSDVLDTGVKIKISRHDLKNQSGIGRPGHKFKNILNG